MDTFELKGNGSVHRNLDGNQQSALGVVAAFRWEVGVLLKKTGGRWEAETGCYHFRLNDERFLVVIGGAGKENSYRASRRLAERYRLRGLLTVGFAAGLVPSLVPGELVIADHVNEPESGTAFATTPGIVATLTGRRGGLVSVPEVVTSETEKRELARRWRAIAADMESVGVARAAEELGLPFAAIKSVTDTVAQSLAIDFRRCRSEHGGLSPWKIVWEGIGSPRKLRDLWLLAANARLAATSLAVALRNA